jgi:hypothetical protein
VTGGRPDIASSIYRLADAMVLFTVTKGERAPRALTTEVSGQVAVVAYTDEQEADRDCPQGYTVYQAQVSDLLSDLPDGTGLVIDPRATSPVYIPSGDKEKVIRAALLFPTGARIRLGQPKTEPAAVLDAIRHNLPSERSIRRAYRCWYQAADARERLLIAVDLDPIPAPDRMRAVGVVTGSLPGLDYKHPVAAVTLDEIPEDLRRSLLENVYPFYVRD